MVGVVVYAGILDKVVGAHLHGHPDLKRSRDLARASHWAGSSEPTCCWRSERSPAWPCSSFPGVILFTLWSLVGPVITIEDRSVGSALRRSWHLVRPCFWLTLGLVTVPLQFEQAVLHAVHYTEIFEHPLVPAFLLNGLLGMVDRLGRRAGRGRARVRPDRTSCQPDVTRQGDRAATPPGTVGSDADRT